MEKDPQLDFLNDLIEKIEKQEYEETQKKAKVIAPFIWGAIVGGIISILHITPSQIVSFIDNILNFFKF